MTKRLLLAAFLSLNLLAPFPLAAAGKSDPVESPPALAVELGAPFRDHAILQRQMRVPVWGWSTPGTEVTVAFANQSQQATAGADCKWMLWLDPMQANAKPLEMTVSETGGKSVILRDILVGDVWLCSGQSNMAWRMSQLKGLADDDLARMNNSLLRLGGVHRDVFAATPQKSVELSWQVCTPEAAAEFSAVAFFFGARLVEALKVPIGLMHASRGGSAQEAWLPAPVLRKRFPEFNDALDTFPAIIERTGGVFSHRSKSKVHGITQRTPAVLYNAKIHPLIPFGIRGAIWYQGESNVKQPEQYGQLFPAMIRQWRSAWGQGDFPFYYVQLSACSEAELPAYLWEAQRLTLSEPNTGMAVINDVGDNNLHPPQKQPVGERLALLALAKDYGREALVFSGPLYTHSVVTDGTIQIHFDHVGSGLVSRDGQPLSHFTIAGEDRRFVTADAVIDGETVVVSSATIKQPVAVRFFFGGAGSPNLMNREGLPASSFRTDRYPRSIEHEPK